MLHVEGSANCFGTIHIMFVVPILLVFVVVFECISSNIVKWDMALSSDEVRIVFFLFVHVKLVLPKFQVAPCYAEISSWYLCLSCCETPASSTCALLPRNI